MTEVEFETFTKVHGKDILRYCRLTAGMLEGDELYQDTLLKLWEQREKLEAEGNLKSYALSISIRLWKNAKRKYARRRRLAPCQSYEDLLENGEDAGGLAGSSGSPENKILEAETNQEIRQAVRKLPEKYKQVILLYYSANLKIREIAKCLKIPESTTKTRFYKAREILKKELEGKFYE